ncbi:Heavy metal-associated isoprenylated plant protein 36 [Glycine soja]
MDAKSAEAVVPLEPLKYQTWFLKVSIHCEGCRRKVKKVLQSIDGVFTTTVDPQQQKVTVTGSVGVETLIRKLVKAGKHAEIWPENLAAGKGKNSGKDKKQQQQQQKKKNEQGEPESAVNNSTTTNAEQNTNSGTKKGIEKNAGENKSTGNSKSGGGESEAAKPENKGGQSEGGSGKKKKKKGQSGGVSAACGDAPAHTGSEVQCSGQMNLSPTRQQSYVYPETYCYPHQVVYLATYNNNRLCPMPMGTMGGPSYYVSSLPYMCAGFDHDSPYYRFQSPPFEIFSDENANGCSIV